MISDSDFVPIRLEKKIESGGGVDARDLDDFDPVVRGALRVGRKSLSENVGHFSRGSLHLLAVFLHPHDAVLSDSAEEPRHRHLWQFEKRHVKNSLFASPVVRI